MIFAEAEYDHEYDENQIEHWKAWRPEEEWVGFACDNFGDVYIYHGGDTPAAVFKKRRNPHRKGILVGVIKQIDAKCERWTENGETRQAEATKKPSFVLLAKKKKREALHFFAGLAGISRKMRRVARLAGKSNFRERS